MFFLIKLGNIIQTLTILKGENNTMNPFFHTDQKEYQHFKPELNPSTIKKQLNFTTKELNVNFNLN